MKIKIDVYRIIVFTILILLLVLVTYLNFTAQGQFIKGLAPNLLSEIIGIIITVFFIDKLIQRNKTINDRKVRNIGIAQLRTRINRQLRLFYHMFKSAGGTLPDNSNDIKLLYVFLNNEYYKTARKLDFNANINNKYNINWYHYLPTACQDIRDTIDSNISKYALYYDADFINLLVELKDSIFLNTMIQVNLIEDFKNHNTTIDFPHLILENEQLETAYNNYSGNLIKLIEIFNKTVSKDIQIIYQPKFDPILDSAIKL